MRTNTANERIRILEFYEKHGLQATLDAFNISKRSLFRYKKIYKQSGALALNPKSTRPKSTRKSKLINSALIKEIKELRAKYPNLGKERLYHLLKPIYEAKNLKCPSISTIGRAIAKESDKMRIAPLYLNSKGKVIKTKRVFKDRKPKNFNPDAFSTFAMDTIQLVNNGIRRYILTMIDINTRVAYAMAMPSKHTKYTALALKALLAGIKGHKISILTDNGSEFALHFENTIKEYNLKHYFTYPRSPKMNAHNERFNKTIQDMFISYNEDLLFYDINEFNRALANWLVEYNTILPHTSLGYKSPINYAIMQDKKCQMLWTCTLA